MKKDFLSEKRLSLNKKMIVCMILIDLFFLGCDLSLEKKSGTLSPTVFQPDISIKDESICMRVLKNEPVEEKYIEEFLNHVKKEYTELKGWELYNTTLYFDQIMTKVYIEGKQFPEIITQGENHCQAKITLKYKVNKKLKEKNFPVEISILYSSNDLAEGYKKMFGPTSEEINQALEKALGNTKKEILEVIEILPSPKLEYNHLYDVLSVQDEDFSLMTWYGNGPDTVTDPFDPYSLDSIPTIRDLRIEYYANASFFGKSVPEVEFVNKALNSFLEETTCKETSDNKYQANYNGKTNIWTFRIRLIESEICPYCAVKVFIPKNGNEKQIQLQEVKSRPYKYGTKECPE